MKKIILLGVLFSSIIFAGPFQSEVDFIVKWGSFTIVGIISFFILSSMIFVVKQKRAAIVEVLGKFHSVKTAGLNFKYPWPFATVKEPINLQIRELRSTIGSRTKDESFLNLPIATQYRVIDNPDSIKHAFYELDDAEEQIRSYINNIARGTINTLTVQELYSAKKGLEQTIKEALSDEFKQFGFEIVNVLVDDPELSQELIDASNQVLASEKFKDAAQNEADALKVKLVGEAQAEKESLALKAEAFVNYRKETSEGNKEAMDLMLGRKIIKDGIVVDNENYVAPAFNEKDILDFFVSIDTNEAIRSASKNGATIVVSTPNNSSSNSIPMIEAMKQ